MRSPRNIYLQAAVENTLSASTRAPFVLLAPDPANPLKAAVWASTTEYEFKDGHENGADNVVSMHTTANFTNGSEQLLNDAVYPAKEGTPVFFVGMHPENGWSTPADPDPKAGKTATKTFNGSEDVMFAPQISGQYAENVEEWPTFKFRHLLTWLRVTVKADGEAVSAAWGKLKSLKIKSKNTVTVDLGREYAADCVTFDGDTELDFYKTGTDAVFLNKDDESTWYALPDDAAEEVAYVLCAPVQATAYDPYEYEQNNVEVKTSEYTLIVETENRSVDVPVDLQNAESSCFAGSTMRHEFLVNLNFKMGNNIAVSAAVTDWVTGGLAAGAVDPNI